MTNVTSDGLADEERDRVRQGLRMAEPPDPDRLAEERRHLVTLESAGLGTRVAGYLRLIGPGYLQSAMTLGGGTAAAAVYAGAAYGYRLLWVAPVAMIMGAFMLAVVSYQTLSTGMRPLAAMRRFAGAPVAWGWAIGALVASVIWHFPQYSLAAAVLGDIGDVVGFSLPPLAFSVVVLVWAVVLSTLYGRAGRGLRLYERLLKYMVWGIVACFGLVVVRTGISDWGALARGFFSFEVPDGRGVTLVVSGLAAAVGVNMVFLYPYSLLARGWGREHRRLARFDLGFGMLLPYVIASSLMVIATANTIYPFAGTGLQPVDASRALAAALDSPTVARVVFDVGVLGMALSTITLHMICAGFVCAELLDWEIGSRKHRLAMLIPTPGVLGPVLWPEIPIWLPVATNVACAFLLPLAYFGFIRLQNSDAYLGPDRPRGVRSGLILAGMSAVTIFFVAALVRYVVTRVA